MCTSTALYAMFSLSYAESCYGTYSRLLSLLSEQAGHETRQHRHRQTTLPLSSSGLPSSVLPAQSSIQETLTRDQTASHLTGVYKNFLFENPPFCPSLQGETRGREGLRRVPNRVDLGTRTWYRPALWQPPCSGSTKTSSSRSSAITGSPSSRAIRGTRIATCRPSSTKCSAVAPWRRAIRPICARTAWKRNGWPLAARVASASPAARYTWMSGWLTSVARSTKVY